MNYLGKLLILTGVILLILGVILIFFEKIPLFGKMPGDIKIEKENFKFYFPIVSSILLSLVISLIVYLVSIFTKK